MVAAWEPGTVEPTDGGAGMADTTPGQPDGTSRPARRFRPSRGRRVGRRHHQRVHPGGPGAQLLPADHTRPQDWPPAHQSGDRRRARRQALASRPLRARVVGAQRPRRRASHPTPPARHAWVHRPGGLTPGGRTPSSSGTFASPLPRDRTSTPPRTPRWRTSSPRRTATRCSSSHPSPRIALTTSRDAESARRWR